MRDKLVAALVRRTLDEDNELNWAIEQLNSYERAALSVLLDENAVLFVKPEDLSELLTALERILAYL